jgi:nucleoside-diphosphate-sugar epimerase
MKVLVTGGSGFIGSALIEELLALGIEVRALLRSTSKVEALSSLKFERIEGDLRDPVSLERAVEGVEVIFHLAGLTQARTLEEFYAANARGVRNLALAADRVRGSGLSRFVLVSSLAASGPARDLQHPRLESEEDHPVSNYGRSKLQGELELLKFRSKFPVAIVRPPIVYGPRDSQLVTVVRTLKRGLQPMAIPEGSGVTSKQHSVIHVSDLVRALIRIGLARSDEMESGEKFYVAESRPVELNEMMEWMSEAMGKEPFRVRVPLSVLTGVAHALDRVAKWTGRTFPLSRDKIEEIRPDFWICSAEKLRERLGWEAEKDSRRAIPETVKWYEKEKWI